MSQAPEIVLSYTSSFITPSWLVKVNTPSLQHSLPVHASWQFNWTLPNFNIISLQIQGSRGYWPGYSLLTFAFEKILKTHFLNNSFIVLVMMSYNFLSKLENFLGCLLMIFGSLHINTLKNVFCHNSNLIPWLWYLSHRTHHMKLQ